MSVSFSPAATACGLDAHTWTSTSNEQGDYYEVCRTCGKQAAWMPAWPRTGA